MEPNKGLKPMELQQSDVFVKISKIYIGEKTTFSTNDAKKAECPHAKVWKDISHLECKLAPDESKMII